jgi:hypothetical protein
MMYARQEEGANIPLIIMLWMTTLCAMLCFGLVGGGIALLVDLMAVGCAVALVCTKNTANRVNGWIKLSLEGIAFVVSFMAAAGVFS